MKNVIIVESPTKSKTIESYLGSDYVVVSSKGHICDLSKKGKGGLGVDVENEFNPTYVQTEEQKKLTNQLKKICKGNKVFLATDPDREGEAISYHLARYLNLDLDEDNRILFHEITKPAILEAIGHVGKVDIKMVDSQETRRILDRIIGFKTSSLLKSRLKSQSAGRVQSVALRMVCDLEEEIQSFIPESYYEAEAHFDNFKLNLYKLNDSTKRITNRQELEEVINNLGDFTLDEIVETENYKDSKPAYTTSTLQQDASYKCGYSGAKTMSIAQKLYEGINLGSETVGLITYMRTDSTHLSDTFVSSAKTYILENFGEKYLGTPKEKKQALAQNAHEAIRPTNVNLNPESIKQYLSSDEYKLYKLIYNRALESLMSKAKFLNTKALFSNYKTIWSIKGQKLLFDGFTVLSGLSEDETNKLLPNFKVGDKYKANEVIILDKETKPKSRYTEATLIKEMEEKGIGRPSTYAQTLQTLTKREYVVIEQKKIVPTEQGIITSNALKKHFPDIFNVEYTKEMEEKLDQIATGDANKVDELSKFYNDFMHEFDLAKDNMEKLQPKETGEICPKCGNKLVVRHGKYGTFVACNNYPECDYIKGNEAIHTNITCPICGTGELLGRTASRGRNKGKLFYSCSNFPKCKAVYNDLPTTNVCPDCGSILLQGENGELYCSAHCQDRVESIKCPNCKDGILIERKATRGKNKGYTFYGCSNYPKCKTIFTDKPLDKKCDLCGSIMLTTNEVEYCSNPKCENHKK